MTPEELAQALADRFEPPHWEERRRNLPLRKLKEQYPDPEDWYEREFVRRGPDDGAQKITHLGYADDGEYLGIRIGSRTYREIAEAVLAIQADAAAND